MLNERLSLQQDELVQIIEKYADKMGGSATLIPFLRFFSDFQKVLAFADRTNCPRRTIA